MKIPRFARDDTWRSVLLVMALATAPESLVAQDSALARMDTTTHRIDVTLPTGRIIQRMTSRADTSQRYALYLPSSFTRERQWPILFLLDPRGRALIPMQRFQPVAERLGYIAISSYNTLSDGPSEPNYSAMNAMLADVQRSLSVDSRRFYLVGFSGTARFAWQMNMQVPGTVAGIIGAGAAVPGGRAWIRSNIGKSSPVLFGTIGTLDPNYEELRNSTASWIRSGCASRRAIRRRPPVAAYRALYARGRVARAPGDATRVEAAQSAVDRLLVRRLAREREPHRLCW